MINNNDDADLINTNGVSSNTNNNNEEGDDDFDNETEIQEQIQTERIRRRNQIIVFLILTAVIIFVIIDSFTTKYVSSAFTSLYTWIDCNPTAGAFVLTFVVALSTLLFIPGALLTIGCGLVYGMIVGLGRGVVIGTTVVFIGASIGSLLSFILGRYLLRDCVSKWLDRYSLFKAVDKTMEKKGFRIFCLLRLSPIIPYNALNYIAGATAVSFRDYTLALIGLLPGERSLNCSFMFSAHITHKFALFSQALHYLYLLVAVRAHLWIWAMTVMMSKEELELPQLVSDSKVHIPQFYMLTITDTLSLMKVVGVAVGVLGIVVISCYAKRELNSIIAEQEQDNNNDGEQVELGQQHQEVISCDNERIDSTEILSER